MIRALNDTWRNNFVSSTDANKYHLMTGVIFGGWLYLFLVLVGPFDGFSLRMSRRLIVMLPYSLIFSFIYIVILPLQTWLFSKRKRWNLSLELVHVFVVFSSCFYPSYLYYKSNFVVGESSFFDYLFRMYLPTIVILIPLLICLRIFFTQFKTKHETKSKTIKIIGKNKKDFLNTTFENLICIKGADNYVDIYYLKNGEPQNKLIRLTLKKVQQLIPNLVKTHRSYLINIEHIIEWNTTCLLYTSPSPRDRG